MIVVKLLVSLTLLLLVDRSTCFTCGTSGRDGFGPFANVQNSFCQAGYVAKVHVKSQRRVHIHGNGTVTDFIDESKPTIVPSDIGPMTSSYGNLIPSDGYLQTEGQWGSRPSHHDQYRVQFLEVFKGDNITNTEAFIYSGVWNPSVESVLESQKIYILMGSGGGKRHMYIGLCDYFWDTTQEWPGYIRQLSKNFLYYQRACGHCTMCTGWRCRTVSEKHCNNTNENESYACVPNNKNICVLRHMSHHQRYPGQY